MHGNVQEWVQDYGGGGASHGSWWVTRLDPLGPLSSSVRGVRGGALYEDAFWLRSAFRDGEEPNARSWGVGVRLVRILSPEEHEKSGALPVEVLGCVAVEVLNEERAFSLPGTAEEMAFMRNRTGGFSEGFAGTGG